MGGVFFFFFNLFYFIFLIYFIYLAVRVFIAACRVFDLHCHVWDLSLWHAGSSSQTGMELRPHPTPASGHTHACTCMHTHTHTHTHTHWTCRVLATGPPGKSLGSVFLTSRNRDEIAEATSKPSHFPRDILFQEGGCC